MNEIDRLALMAVSAASEPLRAVSEAASNLSEEFPRSIELYRIAMQHAVAGVLTDAELGSARQAAVRGSALMLEVQKAYAAAITAMDAAACVASAAVNAEIRRTAN